MQSYYKENLLGKKYVKCSLHPYTSSVSNIIQTVVKLLKQPKTCAYINTAFVARNSNAIETRITCWTAQRAAKKVDLLS